MKRLLKKAWDWLTTIRPDHAAENFYFQKNEKAEELFFPLGIPGKSYFISKKQKKTFIRCYYAVVFTALLIMAIIIGTETIPFIPFLIIALIILEILRFGLPSLYAMQLESNSRSETKNIGFKKELKKTLKSLLLAIVLYFLFGLILILIVIFAFSKTA